jgi:hypothetical protein
VINCSIYNGEIYLFGKQTENHLQLDDHLLSFFKGKERKKDSGIFEVTV